MRQLFSYIWGRGFDRTRRSGFLAFHKASIHTHIWLGAHRKKIRAAAIFFLILPAFVPHMAHAAIIQSLALVGGAAAGLFAFKEDIAKGALRVVNEVLGWCINGLGSLVAVGVGFLLKVAQYNDFLGSSAVSNGWVITRDIANMFFIIVLLVIAFGTILGREEYSYKKTLPKLLIMAVAINFSRTIIGLMIDAAQVVMMTFVNGFASAGAGNFINAFGLNNLLTWQQGGNKDGVAIDILGNGFVALAMGLVLLLVAGFVILSLLGSLLFRIVYLWLLIVTAPLAWMLSVIPAGKAYYDRWWKDFKEQVILGPAVAFFLWLSLMAVGSGLAWNQVVPNGEKLPDIGVGVSQATSSEGILSFVVTTIMLLAAQQMAQELGKATAKMTGMYGKAVSRAWKIGKGTVKAVDLFQASTMGTGLQLTKIPERVKAGLEARQALMQQKADENRLNVATNLAKLPGGNILNMAWVPDAHIKKAFQGGLQGVMGRNMNNLFGTAIVEGVRNRSKTSDDGAIKRVDEKIDEAQKGFKDKEKKAAELTGEKDELAMLRKIYEKLASGGELSKAQFEQAKKSELIVDTNIDFDDYKADKNALGNEMLAKINADHGNATDATLYANRKGVFEREIAAAEREATELRTIAEKKTKPLAEEKAGLERARSRVDAWYMAGDLGVQEELDKMRFKMSAKTKDQIDPSASSDEYATQFMRALSMEDRPLMDQLLKALAKRGDLEKVFPLLGIRGKGGHAANQKLAEILVSKGGFDNRYALQTINRTSELEFDAGSLDNANLVAPDKVTGNFAWRDKKDAAKLTADRIMKQAPEKFFAKLQVKNMFEVGSDGKEYLTDNAAAVLLKIEEAPDTLKDMIQKGLVDREIVRRLKKYIPGLVADEIFSTDTVKTLESVRITSRNVKDDVRKAVGNTWEKMQARGLLPK